MIQPGLGLCGGAYSGHSSKPFKSIQFRGILTFVRIATTGS
ncbi:hypothetical protein JOE29_002101 [Pseudomonas sp. PvP009]|nr:hypothetical protein [Pseudomonas sp. PvP009]